jgi:hypothetical protein
MNLESTLEDLEAQGYFASQVKPQEAHTSAASRLVRISFEKETADKYLASPILGSNFIGGFSVNQMSPKWQAINLTSIRHIENLEGQTVLQTQASLLQIVEQQFLKVPVDIGLKESRVIGFIKAIDGQCFRFETQDYRLLWIPESSVSDLVVENLSAHFKD